jgi:hypothetical protein
MSYIQDEEQLPGYTMNMIEELVDDLNEYRKKVVTGEIVLHVTSKQFTSYRIH